jgi:hypothetical protein
MIGSTNQVTSTTIDALQEVKLFTTGMPAEFGHSAGGLLSTVFKTGTNRWHGSAEDRYIKKELIHRTKLEHLPRINPFTYHELSATMSGRSTFRKSTTARIRHSGCSDSSVTMRRAAKPRILPFRHPKCSTAISTLEACTNLRPGHDAFGQNALCQPAGSECWYRQPFANNQVPQSAGIRRSRIFSATIRMSLRTTHSALSMPPRADQQSHQPRRTTALSNTASTAKSDQQFSSTNKMFGRYSQVRHRSWRDRLSPEIAWSEYDWRAVPIPIDQRNVGAFRDVVDQSDNNQ